MSTIFEIVMKFEDDQEVISTDEKSLYGTIITYGMPITMVVYSNDINKTIDIFKDIRLAACYNIECFDIASEFAITAPSNDTLEKELRKILN